MRARPGKTVLEIGPGWGAFASHALQTGVRFTGITNSEVSQSYLRSKLSNFGDRFDILLTDFYDYEPKEPFDAIVIMGVIEHLPNYERVLKKFSRLLKPGGLVFLDGSAAKKKYELSTFMVRHIYPGNHSFLVLDDFLNKLAKTDLELMEVHNDRWSYFLTFRQWARNLEASKDFVRRTFGDFEYPQVQALSVGRGLRVPHPQSRLLPAARRAWLERVGDGRPSRPEIRARGRDRRDDLQPETRRRRLAHLVARRLSGVGALPR